MNIPIVDLARDDLIEGFYFYKRREAGVGRRFLNSLLSDIERLGLGDRFEMTFYACIEHLQEKGQIYRTVYSDFRRVFLKPFPYALWYGFYGELLVVSLVIHAARDPKRVRALLKPGDYRRFSDSRRYRLEGDEGMGAGPWELATYSIRTR